MSDFSNLKEKIKERENIQENLKDVKYKIVVMSGKGGVGKSTLTTNLARAFVYRGLTSGIIDCDMHGPSIPKLLGVENLRGSIQGDDKYIYPLEITKSLKTISLDLLTENKDTPIIWRGPLKMKMIKDFLEKVKWGGLDYLLFDLPPGTGDEPLSVAQTLPSVDGVIIITTPQDVALHSVRKSIRFAQDLKMPVLGIVENMSGLICPHCQQRIDVFGNGKVIKTAEEFKIKFLGSIPLDPEISEQGDRGISPPLSNKDSIVSQAILKIADEIIQTLNINKTDR